MTILIVDDDEGEHDVLKRVCQQALPGKTLEFKTAADEQTARQLLAMEQFDLILMDMQLTKFPGTEGEALTRLAREQSSLNQNAMIIGGSMDPYCGDSFISAGADIFVCKDQGKKNSYDVLRDEIIKLVQQRTVVEGIDVINNSSMIGKSQAQP